MLALSTRWAGRTLGAACLALSLGFSSGPANAPQKKAATAEVGKPTPAFQLNDHEGKKVAFGGESDHWRVLAFYPKALTGG